ncbi:MAG: DUF3570 domain-containing protein, partial [Gammaproteobacteria bacterium]
MRALRTGLTLSAVLLGQMAWAGVLPEDRADLLYHRYDGGGVTIDGPSLLVRKSIGENFSGVVNYYVDNVSSASIDVVTQGSPYSEERTEISLAGDYLYEDTTFTLGYTDSDESDYQASTVAFGVSQDFFGNMSTLSLVFGRANDEVSRNGDPDFERDIDRWIYRLNFTQVFTPNFIMGASWETISDEGYLNNPYRSFRYVDPLAADGFSWAEERYPNTRTSNAAAIRGRYFLPYGAAITGEARYFSDDWDISAYNLELGYVHSLGDAWTLEVAYRYYDQDGADFYSDLFARIDEFNFQGRDKELSTFSNYSVRLGATYTFLEGRWLFLNKGTANLFYQYFDFSYDDFRDARVTGAPAGQEPLYSMSADVW